MDGLLCWVGGWMGRGMGGWLGGWLVCWLARGLGGWLAGWLAGWLGAGWLAGWLGRCLGRWVAGWSVAGWLLVSSSSFPHLVLSIMSAQKRYSQCSHCSFHIMTADNNQWRSGSKPTTKASKHFPVSIPVSHWITLFELLVISSLSLQFSDPRSSCVL